MLHNNLAAFLVVVAAAGLLYLVMIIACTATGDLKRPTDTTTTSTTAAAAAAKPPPEVRLTFQERLAQRRIYDQLASLYDDPIPTHEVHLVHYRRNEDDEHKQIEVVAQIHAPLSPAESLARPPSPSRTQKGDVCYVR